MGWTFKPAPTPVDRRRECRAELSDRYEVLRDAVVGTTWYAAVRNKETGEVHAQVVLTAIDRRSYCNFGIKWMGEECGPCECDCPEAILSLLSPTTNTYALEWRRRCRARREEKRRESLRKDVLRTAPFGARLRVTLFDDTERTVIKMKPGRQFKTWWLLIENECKYVPKKFVVGARLA